MRKILEKEHDEDHKNGSHSSNEVSVQTIGTSPMVFWSFGLLKFKNFRLLSNYEGSGSIFLTYTCLWNDHDKIKIYEFGSLYGGEDYGMRVVTKVKCPELEIIKIYAGKSLTITVEIFTVPDGYKSFATNSFQYHDSLTGAGFHRDKSKSAKLAVNDLRTLMVAFKG